MPLGHEYGNGTGNEKRRNQAGQHMFPGIFLEHHECLQPGLPDNRVGPGHEIGHEKQSHQNEQFGFFFHQARLLYDTISSGSK